MNEPEYNYWDWHCIKQDVLFRDKQCVYCHTPLDKYTITIDHYIPKSKGGSNKLENLVAACKECNNKKDNMMPLDFIANVKRKPIEKPIEKDIIKPIIKPIKKESFFFSYCKKIILL